MNTSSIFVVLLVVLTVNAAPGEKGSRCKVPWADIGAYGTNCSDRACGFFLVPFSTGSCDPGLYCCWGEPPASPRPNQQSPSPNQQPPPPNEQPSQPAPQ